MALNAVDMTHKLHPLEFNSPVVNEEWLVQACLRQHNTVMDFPMDQLTFQQSYLHYVEFLYLCSKNRGEVTVPNMMADFMWHSHMLDTAAYQSDHRAMIGFVLNHNDEFTGPELRKHGERSNDLSDRELPLSQAPDKTIKQKPRSKGIKQEGTEFKAGGHHQFIDYGPEMYWNEPVTIDSAPFGEVSFGPCEVVALTSSIPGETGGCGATEASFAGCGGVDNNEGAGCGGVEPAEGGCAATDETVGGCAANE